MTQPTVNNSLAVFLVNPSVRAVMVTYEGFEDHEFKRPSGKLSMHKTLDPDLKVGDFIVVPTGTRVGFTVCRVASFVNEADIDFDSTTKVDWIAATFDPTTYNMVLQKESGFIQAVKDADKRRRTEDLKKSLLANLPDEQIKALPVVDLVVEAK